MFAPFSKKPPVSPIVRYVSETDKLLIIPQVSRSRNSHPEEFSYNPGGPFQRDFGVVRVFGKAHLQCSIA
jgi:hypothetical protein